nr:reverse transcriptase domain-containing protein [Tanacetum cinerariifolium]
FSDGISDKFSVKTGSCKVKAARLDLVLLGEKQFWASAKSKTVNDVKQIHATVDGKTVVTSESTVRSDLHFNDEDDRMGMPTKYLCSYWNGWVRLPWTRNAFAITANPVRREYNGIIPKCVSCNLHHLPEMPWTMEKDCRVAPRMVNSVNARNPSVAPGACYECGGTDHFKGQGRGKNDNQIRGRKFLLGAEEARQDPNIMTGVFTLNDQYATTLFDSGSDYSFVSITCIPLIGIEPNELGFSYEIEIATGQLVY